MRIVFEGWCSRMRVESYRLLVVEYGLYLRFSFEDRLSLRFVSYSVWRLITLEVWVGRSIMFEVGEFVYYMREE